MKTYDEITAGLKAYAGRVGGKASMMRILDAKKATFYRALDDENPVLPAPDVLCDWMDKMHVQVVFPGEHAEDYVYVPKVAAIAGAGASFVVDDEATGLYAFRRAFLEREHIHTQDLVMMMVSGDSMEPLIRDGDTVLVDQTDDSPADGKIYVLRIDDALMVKRMEKIPGGWRVKSDNPDRGHYDLRGDELESLHVFGRVRWFGRVV